jgi:hypothetical protein
LVNCAAPSLASFVVGCVVGGACVLFLAAVIFVRMMKYRLKAASKLARAALNLYEDYENDRIQGFVGEDASADADAEWYEVPADSWEAFEDAVDDAFDEFDDVNKETST